MNKGKHKTKKYPKIINMTPSAHVDLVKDMFSTISGKYDILNHVMSVRRDVAWRRFTVRKLKFFETYRFLDLATGTADMAIEAAKRHPKIKVTALDFVQEMMDIGRKKILRHNLSSRVNLLRGDATALPFPANSFDTAGISFGIRNIPEKAAALREMSRVVVPGGQILILEMTLPEARFFRGLYGIYLNRILPRLAALFSPNPAAYLYLGDSILNFPKAREFVRFMTEQGLQDVRAYPLTLGITHLFTGIAE